MDVAARNELNDKIDRRSKTVTRLLIKRLTDEVRQHFPDARSIRVITVDGSDTYEVNRVAGHRSTVLWRAQYGDKLSSKVGDEAAQLINLDAAQYMRLGGLRIIPINHRQAKPYREYSIHLYPMV